MTDEPYLRMAISLTNTAYEAEVTAFSLRYFQLALFSPMAASLLLEEFDTLLDASPPLSSVPCRNLPLVHANAALLHVVLQCVLEALSLSSSVTLTFP